FVERSITAHRKCGVTALFRCLARQLHRLTTAAGLARRNVPAQLLERRECRAELRVMAAHPGRRIVNDDRAHGFQCHDQNASVPSPILCGGAAPLTSATQTSPVVADEPLV